MLNLKEKYSKCIFCENYYGSCFDEPLCLTCHFFVFPNTIEQDNAGNGATSNTNNGSLDNSNGSSNKLSAHQSIDFTSKLNVFLGSANFGSLSCSSHSVNHLNEINFKILRNFDQKLESNDSGNEDSDDQQTNTLQNDFENNHSILFNCNLKTKKPADSSSETNNNNNRNINNNLDLDKYSNKLNDENIVQSKEDLKQSIILDKDSNETNQNSLPNSSIDSLNNINKLPNEVLLSIFLNLDDLSLWSVSQVCKRWYDLIKQEITQEKWKNFVHDRWIFCKPSIQTNSYQELYSQLVQSSNCFYCLQQIHNRPKLELSEELKRSWRHKRLLLELRSLQQDPPDGINARPLDSSCYYWQASITGPVGSPYEGGIFYLYLNIPQSYPLNPPLVRFITKIYHPNISRHGDIGLDSIHENWSLALTISKVLISIQSLLTDPYTHVCMEKDIGLMYKTNRDLYEKYARIYTWKYAMSDYIIFNDHLDLIDYFNNFLTSSSNDNI